MGKEFWDDCTSFCEAEVLRIVHFYEEEFQLLAGHILIRREIV